MAHRDASLYRHAQELFVATVADTDPAARVPACPAWTVHDLVAHQEHQLTSACAGIFPLEDAIGAMTASDPATRSAARRRQEDWIEHGLRVRRQMSMEDLLATWATTVEGAPAAALEGLLPDVAVHLFDLLGACGDRRHRDAEFVRAALVHWHAWSQERLVQAGARGLCLEHPESLGPANADVVVGGSSFELLRALTGRRSVAQADRLRWNNASDEQRALFPVYGWTTSDLNE